MKSHYKMFEQAARLVVQHQQGSVSLLQRRLKLGFSRAACIMDELEQCGIVGPPDGSKPREVFIQDEAALELKLNDLAQDYRSSAKSYRETNDYNSAAKDFTLKERSISNALKVLELVKGATQEQIQAAYREQMKKYHPDKVSHLGNEFQILAEKKTKLINRAYEILKKV